MITTVFFDLDGTLLPMDQDVFIGSYLKGLVKKVAPHGYDPETLAKSIWAGTGAMVKNDGSKTNEAVFWDTFCGFFGEQAKKDLPIFDDFYRNEFQLVRHDCGYTPQSAELIHALRAMGLRLVLATNPLFPALATHSRVRWAGLETTDFELITTYENSRHCKPNPDYYRDILEQLGLSAEECLMVGNDVSEDMIAETLGFRVFLLTDDLINKGGISIDRFPHGSFSELLAYIKELMQ